MDVFSDFYVSCRHDADSRSVCGYLSSKWSQVTMKVYRYIVGGGNGADALIEAYIVS
jgi:hypothetical protein